jgi:enoyl-[acyl-carrier protein] reductase III
MTEFADRVVLITGASRGIGRATALLLAERGADVVVHYKRAEAEAKEVVERVLALGRQAMSVQADLEQPDDIRQMFAQAAERFGRLDIFVSNAAATAFRRVLDLKPHHLLRTYQISVFGFVHAAQEAAKLMAGRRGRIVTVSSFPTLRYLPNYAALGSAKAALETLTRYLAVELAPLGVIVNGVSPGLLETDSSRVYAGDDFERFEREIIESTPGGRLGTPEDIARVIAFLCSDDAEWIVGQTIMVDGGMTIPSPYLKRPPASAR